MSIRSLSHMCLQTIQEAVGYNLFEFARILYSVGLEHLSNDICKSHSEVEERKILCDEILSHLNYKLPVPAWEAMAYYPPEWLLLCVSVMIENSYSADEISDYVVHLVELLNPKVIDSVLNDYYPNVRLLGLYKMLCYTKTRECHDKLLKLLAQLPGQSRLLPDDKLNKMLAAAVQGQTVDQYAVSNGVLWMHAPFVKHIISAIESDSLAIKYISSLANHTGRVYTYRNFNLKMNSLIRELINQLFGPGKRFTVEVIATHAPDFGWQTKEDLILMLHYHQDEEFFTEVYDVFVNL